MEENKRRSVKGMTPLQRYTEINLKFVESVTELLKIFPKKLNSSNKN